jgi:hypothetical protein
MLMDALICPNCGASLPAPAVDRDVVTCQYCNTTFRVPKTLTPEPDLGDLILGADFSSKPIAGWAFPNEESIRLIPGPTPELRAKFAPADTLNYVLNSSGYFDDVDVSVSIRFYEGELKSIDAGISLRYQKSVGSYAFLISADGTYAVGCYLPGDDGSMAWKPIVNWTTHSAVRTGLNQMNRLRVSAERDHLRVHINGVLATSLHDGRHEAGEILIDVEGGKTSSVEAGFTGLQVREIKQH